MELGIDKSTVQRYERENNIPKGDILQRIHDVFDINLNWLLHEEGNRYIIKDDFHDQVKVDDSLQIELRGPDGRIRPEDSGTVNAHGRSIKAKGVRYKMGDEELLDADDMLVRSPENGEHEDCFGSRKVDRPNPRAIDLGQAMTMFTNIMVSGDQTILRALLSNLEAFSRAIDLDKTQSDRINKLEKECNDLKKRIETLEVKHEPSGSHLSSEEELKKSRVV